MPTNIYVSSRTRDRTAGNAVINITPYSSMYILYNHIVSPMDYEAVRMLLPFAACEIQQCVNVTIVDDFEDEPNENFFYTLEMSPGLNPKIELDKTLGEIVIIDNDGQYSICTIQHFHKSTFPLNLLAVVLNQQIQFKLVMIPLCI